MNSRLRWRSLTIAWTFPVSRSIPPTGSACYVTFVLAILGKRWRERPGLGGKSGAVVAMAWIPGFLSKETIATRLMALRDLAAFSFQNSGPSR